MDRFSIDEIFQFALTIEENGKKFYEEQAEKFKDKTEIKEFFLYLAEQEGEHKRIFDNILESFSKYKAPDNFPEEYFSYLKVFAENLIFNKSIERELSMVNDVVSAIDFAMRREMDSISYYSEIKNVVKFENSEKIDEIIAEERVHFIDLVNKKNEMLKKNS